jgi:AcrR family transcriptional regulator
MGTGGSRREAILEAALVLFAERTYAATPMPMLAERAGVGAGTLYRYFASKDVLVNEVFRAAKDDLLGRLFGQAQSGGSVQQQFTALWQRLGEFARERPEAFAFLELQDHEGYLDPASRRMDGDVREAARTFVEQAQASGAVATGDPAVMVAVVMGAMTGLFKSWRAGEIELSDAVLQAAGARVWCALTGPPVATEKGPEDR